MSETPRVVLLMITSSGFDRGLLEGITSYAQIHGPWIFLLSGDHPDLPIPASDSLSGGFSGREYLTGWKLKGLMPHFEQLGATGVIGRIHGSWMIEEVLSSGLPAVGMSFPEEEIAQFHLQSKFSEIIVDTRKTGQLAAEHFLERGYWNYAFCGYEGFAWSDGRLKGFSERLSEAGFTPHVYHPSKLRNHLDWKKEMAMVVSWLKSLPRPVAVMACNDKRGRQTIEACLLSGLKVPDDVAVVGVDNDQIYGNLSHPPLSSVSLNLSKAGYQIAEHLDHLMHKKERTPRQIVVEALWVVSRRSSDFIATDDPHVAVALRFICNHAKEALEVSDVVREAGISRRSLEIRFQTVLGKSIHAEIHRVRLGYAKQLLVETNLSVERIAGLAGFCSISHLSSAFRLETGMTPAQYRRYTRISQ